MLFVQPLMHSFPFGLSQKLSETQPKSTAINSIDAALETELFLAVRFFPYPLGYIKIFDKNCDTKLTIPGRNNGRNFSGITALTAGKIRHRSRY